MKLIDLLVEELPKRGGWPAYAECAAQEHDYQICFSGINDIEFVKDEWSSGLLDVIYRAPFPSRKADDYRTAIITREQYEAALAEKQEKDKPVWDGVGLPPVGCECEIKRIVAWMPVTIRFISNCYTVFTTPEGTEDCYQTCNLQFRPLRTEADKKREAAIKQMMSIPKPCGFAIQSICEQLYDAIIAGEIDGLGKV